MQAAETAILDKLSVKVILPDKRVKVELLLQWSKIDVNTTK